MLSYNLNNAKGIITKNGTGANINKGWNIQAFTYLGLNYVQAKFQGDDINIVNPIGFNTLCYQRTQTQRTAYLNGNVVDNRISAPSTITSSAYQMRTTWDTFGSANHQISRIVIYNRALTKNEILQHSISPFCFIN
jgi:hypothetical protein